MIPRSPDGLDIIILGGGVAGLTTALALTKFAPEGYVPRIQIFEIRPEPATIGGAVNLTPNALRLLDYLGALQEIKFCNYGATIDYLEIFDLYSKRLTTADFTGPDGKGIGDPPYKALRINRGDALKGLLAALDKHENISLTCGKKTIDIKETDDNVTLVFEDGQTVTGDLLIGADGIHSVTRLKHVEPGRKAIYSGVANAFGFAPVDKDFKVHFQSTALNFARRGMLLTSFHNSAKDSVYVGALMQVTDVGSRDGWKVVGADSEKVRADILDRLSDSKIPCIQPLIQKAQDFYLWPVYTLSKNGKWYTDRVMLLGDAAHAMPPQGESTGIIFEDTVLFSRFFCRWIEKGKPNTMSEPFAAFDKLRRRRIEIAYDDSKNVVNTVSDAGWLGHTIKTYAIPLYIWYTNSYRHKHFAEDFTTIDIGY